MHPVGDESSSPYDPFRVYSYPELSADTRSTLPIEAVFAASAGAQRDFHFVNGQHQPSITVRAGKPFVLRVLHASGGKPLPLTLSDSAACNRSVIAWDGVYLDANLCGCGGGAAGGGVAGGVAAAVRGAGPVLAGHGG
jgi:FtsP/CotA-like multicopper oxidase with cupredoxin domain